MRIAVLGATGRMGQAVIRAVLEKDKEFLSGGHIGKDKSKIDKDLGVIAGGPDYTTEGMHGYFLNHTAQARRIIEMVDSAHLYLHLDCP